MSSAPLLDARQPTPEPEPPCPPLRCSALLAPLDLSGPWILEAVGSGEEYTFEIEHAVGEATLVMRQVGLATAVDLKGTLEDGFLKWVNTPLHARVSVVDDETMVDGVATQGLGGPAAQRFVMRKDKPLHRFVVHCAPPTLPHALPPNDATGTGLWQLEARGGRLVLADLFAGCRPVRVPVRREPEDGPTFELLTEDGGVVVAAVGELEPGRPWIHGFLHHHAHGHIEAIGAAASAIVFTV